jgi:hypothetical protein
MTPNHDKMSQELAKERGQLSDISFQFEQQVDQKKYFNG